MSSCFSMTNGCRQGAVLSAIAYCFYCEDLFALLKKRRTGCWVLNNYHGIFGYSDDNWLLAPSLGSLQDMLTTCENYAKCHNLKFSTDPDPVKCKTKLMAFMKRPRQLPNLILCGVSLPWVNKIILSFFLHFRHSIERYKNVRYPYHWEISHFAQTGRGTG